MPEPGTTPAADLRQRIATAIRDATCTGDCGQAERECQDHRIQPVVWHHGVLAAVEATPEQIADAALAVRDQEMEALRAELVATVANLNRADEDGARAEAAERRAQAVARTAREEIRRRREAEDTLDRVRNVAVELELFAEAALKVPDRELYATIAKSLRTALTPPVDQNRGGQ